MSFIKKIIDFGTKLTGEAPENDASKEKVVEEAEVMEEVAEETALEEAAEEYLDIVFGKGKHHPFYKELFIAGAKWDRQQMMKIITKDDNLEEAGIQYVKTHFRDIDWTPDVIKLCLEEAFISGGEYVFKKIKYE